MLRVHVAIVFAVALALSACGGSSASDSDTTVPEPVAVAPGATTARADDDVNDADEPSRHSGADELVDDSPDPEPPDEAEGEGERVEASVLMRMFGAGGTTSVFGSTGTPARWWVLVRDPGGAEERYRADASEPASLSAGQVFGGEVAGWRCQLQSASVQSNVQINRGTRTTTQRAQRTLVCEKDGQRRSATAECGYDEDASGRTPVVTPAELDVGDSRDPHQITLSCDPPLP